MRFALIWINGADDDEEFPGMVSGVYAERDDWCVSSISPLSRHSCRVGEELSFSGASTAFKAPEEQTNRTLNQ